MWTERFVSCVVKSTWRALFSFTFEFPPMRNEKPARYTRVQGWPLMRVTESDFNEISKMKRSIGCYRDKVALFQYISTGMLYQSEIDFEK